MLFYEANLIKHDKPTYYVNQNLPHFKHGSSEDFGDVASSWEGFMIIWSYSALLVWEKKCCDSQTRSDYSVLILYVFNINLIWCD